MLKSHPLLPYGECETFQYIKTFTKNWIRKPTGKDFLEGVTQGAGAFVEDSLAMNPKG